MEQVRRPRLRDAVVPAALFALGFVELITMRTDGWLAAAGVELVAAVVLTFRRPWPAIVAPLTVAVLALIPLTGTRMEDAAAPLFFIVLAIFFIGRHVGRRGGLVALAVIVGLVSADVGFATEPADWTDVMFVLAITIPPYFFGRISRRLAEQAALLEQQQEQIRSQAIRDERDRIARELHDVIAHSVSAMVVQTAAAQDLVRTQPDRAEELLDSVAQTGRHALAETGRLLHLIRDEGDELGLLPAPGLADLPELVEGFRARGVTVEAALDIPKDRVPSGVDVSAYRVVQEALTNATKHGTGPVQLVVERTPRDLRIACSNAVAHANGQGSGLGLQGMAERVSVVGGSIRHGVNGDGRFHLDVTIPMPAGAHA